MGLVELFFGIHFSWHFTSSQVGVHLNQTGFTANLVEQFCCESWDATLTATPYCSGVPTNLIAPSTDANDSPAQLCHTTIYQSLIGSIGWLATGTWPDLSPVHSFLLSYNSKPSTGHMRRPLCITLHPLRSWPWNSFYIVRYRSNSHFCALHWLIRHLSLHWHQTSLSYTLPTSYILQWCLLGLSDRFSHLGWKLTS